MAIARDTYLHFGGSSGTSISTSYTCTGSNRVLIVFFFHENSTTGSVTYNSVSMTQVATISYGNLGVHNIDAYVLMNPASGANTLTATSSGTTFNDAWAWSGTGVGQTNQPDATDATQNLVATDLSSTITTVASNCWVIAHGINNNGAPTTGSGVLTALGTDASVGTILLDSNTTVPVGANTYGFTGAPLNGNTTLIGVSVSPVSGHNLTLVGTGT